MEWVTVWDLGKLPHEALWRFVVTYAVFIFAAPLLLLGVRVLDHLLDPGFRRAWMKLIWTVIGWGFIFAISLAALDFLHLYLRYVTGLYTVTEGRVENFTPALDRGSHFRRESFTVGDRGFAYHHRFVCVCFNRPAIAGGPMRQGLYVRLSHVGAAILKIEIRERKSAAE